MFYVLLVIVILLFAIYFTSREEMFRSCRDCDGYEMAPNGTPVLNPFLWPYSGTGCVDDVYILGKDAGVDIGTGIAPLTHLSAPDHVILTN